MTLKEKIDVSKLPQHVAIIMDGNGRWAMNQGNKRIFGHEHGVDAVRSVIEGVGEIGIKFLTLYAFSTENWSRPKEEVDGLMNLLIQAINEVTVTLKKEHVSLQAIGDFSSLPASVQEKLNWSIEELKDGDRLRIIVALSYSSRWEITEAVRNIAADVKAGKLETTSINRELIDQYLTTRGIPDPELLIRTGGETRISNFLLWQIAYSELYFTPILWPDFRKEDLFQAICDFQGRERRFGKTSQQVVR